MDGDLNLFDFLKENYDLKGLKFLGQPDNLSDYIKEHINRYKKKGKKIFFQGNEYELFEWYYHCYFF